MSSQCYIQKGAIQQFLCLFTYVADAATHVQLVSETGRRSVLSSGRLEIIINEQCGTVCSNSFDMTDADVACKELRFERANSFTTAAAIG